MACIGPLAGLVLLVVPLEWSFRVGAGLVAGALLVLALLFSIGETAVAAVRRARVQQLIDEGSGAARDLQRLMENSTGLVASFRIVTTAAAVGASALLITVAATSLSQSLGSTGGAYILLVFVTLIVILVPIQQVGPALGSRYAEPVALELARPLRGAVWVLSPIVKVLDALGHLIYRAPRSPGTRNGAGTPSAVTEAQIMLQVDVAEEEGVLEQDEGEMIRSIFEFGDTVAREIMVPRIDMKAVPDSATLAEAVDRAVVTGHSRIPIYQGTVDNVTGIFYVKDSLRYLREGRLDIHVREVSREAHFVPEAKKVDELLSEMQSRRVHVAIVVDEYGGTAGLLTIEDILEEIVGEIQDEYDAEEAQVEQVSEHEVVIDALMTLDDVNDLLSLDLQEEDVDTLGGFVYSRLGRVPLQGDEIVSGGTRLVVDEVEGNRINKVRIITPLQPAPATPAHATPAHATAVPPAPPDAQTKDAHTKDAQTRDTLGDSARDEANG